MPAWTADPHGVVFKFKVNQRTQPLRPERPPTAIGPWHNRGS